MSRGREGGPAGGGGMVGVGVGGGAFRVLRLRVLQQVLVEYHWVETKQQHSGLQQQEPRAPLTRCS